MLTSHFLIALAAAARKCTRVELQVTSVVSTTIPVTSIASSTTVPVSSVASNTTLPVSADVSTTATTTPKATPVPACVPQKAQFFSPYVDVTIGIDINDISKATGQKVFTLAFVTGEKGEPVWNTFPVKEAHYLSEIQAFRKSGGEVMVSFGGQAGQELALQIPTVEGLVAKYQEVIDMYEIKMVDFDIEGPATGDIASLTRRSKALKIIKDNNPGLFVSFTLAVGPFGLVDAGKNVLKIAVDNGLKIDSVNIMTMDYFVPLDGKTMGEVAVQAATFAAKQIKDLKMDAKLGITSMIGVNDNPSEIFNQKDAREVLAFARSNFFVGSIGIWSADRDHNDADASVASSSKIEQTEFEFTNIFKPLTTEC
jgi:hypothetical protein